MPHHNCSLCLLRVNSNQKLRRAGELELWSIAHSSFQDLNISRHNIICKSCRAKIIFQNQRRGRVNVHEILSNNSKNRKGTRFGSQIPGLNVLPMELERDSEPESYMMDSEIDLNISIPESRESSCPFPVGSQVSQPWTAESQGSLLGSRPSSAESQGSLLGSRPSSAESQGSLLGSRPSSAESQGSLLGSRPSTAVSQRSLLESQGSLLGSRPSTASSILSINSRNTTIIEIPAVFKSESRCFICKSKSGRSRIPKSALLQVLKLHFIYIPEENRCCARHLINGRFNDEALENITSDKEEFRLDGQELTSWISSLVLNLNDKKAMMDFGPSSELSDEEFRLLLGLQRTDFEELVSVCKQHMNNTDIRTVDNAVGLFFMKMRLNLPQKVLGLLFGITSQQRVSDAIQAVGKCLNLHFVPLHLGFNHLSREEAATHDSPFFKKILDSNPDAIHTCWDATYLPCQKPGNFEIQRKTYSMHKHTNLVKPMMGCFADGYLLTTEGPFYSDSSNNDASIMKQMFRQEGPNSINAFVRPGDVFIVDRGFRDVITDLEAKGIVAYMPDLVKGNHQFPASAANSSRRVTMLRLIIEIVNGQIKQRFRFFDSTIQASYMASIPMFWNVVCAVHNAYGTRFRLAPEDEDYIVNRVQQDLEKSNVLQLYIENKNLSRKNVCWTRTEDADLDGFPVLTICDLKKITLGTFQIKMSDRYINQHLGDGGEYVMYVHREEEDLFRVKLQSRHSRRAVHQVWVRVNQQQQGHEAIDSYYCSCKTGARTLGCCSHICSFLKYAGVDRNIPPAVRRKSRAIEFLDATADLIDSDEED